MVVKLWVLERPNQITAVCCGAYVIDLITESFLGTDRSLPPPFPDTFSLISDVESYHQARRDWQAQFFNHESMQTNTMLASVLMGSTGWSGEWICTYNDLTESGKALYDLLQAMYPEGELHLATFLDT